MQTNNTYNQISHIEINGNQNPQFEINGNQNPQFEIKEINQDIPNDNNIINQDILNENNEINQNENTVIDIHDQPQGGKLTPKQEKRLKHIIFYQFFIPRVYTTALIAYLMTLGLRTIYVITDNLLFEKEIETSTNQELFEEELVRININDIISSCIMAPLIEEFFFRSLIFKTINWIGKKTQKKVKVIGILIRILAFIISSFIFAFAHYGFRFELLREEIRSFPNYFITGLTLAYAYNRDGYILASVLAHSLNNTIAILFVSIRNHIKTVGFISFFLSNFISS